MSRWNFWQYLPLVGGVALGWYMLSRPAEGIDVSHHQGAIDWSQVARHKDFAIIKATEGSTYVDPAFRENWIGAARAGMDRGMYHFWRGTTSSVRDQAEHLVGHIQAYGAGDLPVAIDVETSQIDSALEAGKTPQQIIADLAYLGVRVQQVALRAPMIYMSARGMRHLGNIGGLQHFGLWVADYKYDPPRVPAGWGRWNYWQYSSSGRVPGISGDVDQDRRA